MAVTTPRFPRTYAELKEKVPNIGIVIVAILSWYFFSLSISLYNKWMFGPHLNFKFPILVTACHQLTLFWLSCITLIIWPRFRLNYTDSKETTPVQPMSYLMNPKTYFLRIVPCALASAGDIGLGNSSLKFITISLYTMLKSSAVLIFTLFWGVLLRLEKFTSKLLAITLVMTVGVTMLVYGQGANHEAASPISEEESVIQQRLIKRAVQLVGSNLGKLSDAVGSSGTTGTSTGSTTDALVTYVASSAVVLGSMLVFLASCMSGLRWALTQIALRGNKYTKNPILTIFYLSPAMAITLIFVGSYIEGFENFASSNIWIEKGVAGTMFLLLIPGLFAFLMTLSQFIILQNAPLLTLSIAGIFRELITIFLGWLVFGDQLNWINGLGILVTLGDLIWYNFYRWEQANSNQPSSSSSSSSNNSTQSSETLSSSPSSEEGDVETVLLTNMQKSA
ncbi:hypothetical protein B5S28_g4877 [[Candida] boidinii]|nr:hypothetical protein B5S28_g4877 [[Candida] boidinii]OWB62381.1 hypothetical protein B5S29_g3307 [[Candida] boidinii]